MKKFLIATAMFATVSLQAQNNPPPQTTFVTTMAQYFTAFDANSTTFTSDRILLDTKMIYAQGLNFADDLSINVKLHAPSAVPLSSHNYAYAEAGMRCAGINGVLAGGATGFGYAFVHWDTRLAVGVDGGCDKLIHSSYVESYIDVRKALVGSANAYAGLRLGFEKNFKGPSRNDLNVYVIAGIKF